MNQRSVGLDLFRLLSVAFIFLFHSHIHIQCDYGLFNDYINVSAIYMSAFFLLSGFANYLTWNSRDLRDISVIRVFYLKRLVNIVPLYYVAAILYVLFLGMESLYENVLLAPIELLGIQSSFASIFSVTHNGGTWFVSCILICYLIYPFIQEIVKQLSHKTKLLLMTVGCFILIYSPLIVKHYNLVTTYANPFYRVIEFAIGTIICSEMENIKRSSVSKYLFSWYAIIAEYVVFVVGVSMTVNMEKSVKDYMFYSWIALPMFILNLITLAGMDFPKVMMRSRLLRYMCEISYAFFLAQLFVWKMTLFALTEIGMDNNVLRIVASLLICTVIATLLHEIVEKPIAKLFRRKTTGMCHA